MGRALGKQRRKVCGSIMRPQVRARAALAASTGEPTQGLLCCPEPVRLYQRIAPVHASAIQPCRLPGVAACLS